MQAIKDFFNEHRANGFKGAVPFILFGILAFVLGASFIPGNAIYKAPEANKTLGFALGAASIVAFFAGSKFFAPKKGERFWKAFYALWVVVVLGLGIAAFSLLVLHGGPLGLNGKTV